MKTYAAAARIGRPTSKGSHDSSRPVATTRTYARARAARRFRIRRSHGPKSRAPAGVPGAAALGRAPPAATASVSETVRGPAAGPGAAPRSVSESLAGIGQSPSYHPHEHVFQRRFVLLQPDDAHVRGLQLVDDGADDAVVDQAPRQKLRAVLRAVGDDAENARELPEAAQHVLVRPGQHRTDLRFQHDLVLHGALEA